MLGYCSRSFVLGLRASSSGRSVPGMFRCSKDGLTVDTDNTSVYCGFGTASSVFLVQVDFRP